MDKPTCAREGDGKSGWLSPEGRLYKCQYKGHWEKADEILRNKLGIGYSFASEDKLKNMYQWISMGSSIGMSYVSIATGEDGPRPYTEKQIAWLKRNYTKLDKEQQDYLDLYGPLSGWKPKE